MADIAALLTAWLAVATSEDEAWAAARPGPPLAEVAARLATVPRPFLDDAVSISALAGDVVGSPLAAIPFVDDPRVRTGAAIGLWLRASEDLIGPFTPSARWAHPRGVDALALRLAPVVDPQDWLADDERREEATRTYLLWSGFLPAGEDAATARSLFDARDSLSRDAALTDAFAVQRHRADLARRLAEARAQEAAARYSSE